MLSGGQQGGDLRRCGAGLVRPAGAVADVDGQRWGDAQLGGQCLERFGLLRAGDEDITLGVLPKACARRSDWAVHSAECTREQGRPVAAEIAPRSSGWVSAQLHRRMF